MPKKKNNLIPILLKLPKDIVERVDVACYESNVTRSQFLRQSVKRNIDHYEKNEKKYFLQLIRQGSS